MITPTASQMITPNFYSDALSTKLDAKNPKAIGGQFEAMFYRILFDEMRTEEDPLMGDNEGQQVQAMFHDELSNLLGSQGKLGIADLVMKDIDRRQGLLKG